MKEYNAPLGSGVGKVPIQELISRKKELGDEIYALSITIEQGHDLLDELKEKQIELKRVNRAICAVREKESRLKNNYCPSK